MTESGFAVPAFVTIGPGSGPIPGEVLDFIDPGRAYAVRSSSPLEDGQSRSYAGQFRTRLDVPGTEDAISAAVAEVVASASSPAIDAYDAAGSGLPMTAIVQHMVPAVRSGVAFSRNPVTGMDEVVIESVDGLGDKLVDGRATPERWVFRWGRFTARPTSGDDALAELVARGVREIAASLGHPVDAEWAWDGSTLWWLQARPITGIDDVTIYSRRIAKEVLPGVIAPLTWSVNVPVVNRAWIRLLEDAVGPCGLEPEKLARRFGGRAYFDMTALGSVFERLGLPRDSLELLIGLDDGPEKPSMRPSTPAVLRNLPRMSALGWRLLRYPGRVSAELERLLKESRAEPTPDSLTDNDLADAIGRAMARAERAAYANIVVPLMASAWSGRARRALQGAGSDPDSVDPTAGLPDSGVHDPSRALDEIRRCVSELSPSRRSWLAEADWDGIRNDETLEGLVGAVASFLERFGALGDRTTDLTSTPWREDPVRVVRMALAPAPDRVARPVRDLPVGRRVIGTVERAGRLQILREGVSQAYTTIYMALRPLFLEAGRRLAARGDLAHPGDIVNLEVGEVLDALRGAEVELGVLLSRAAEMAEAESYRVPDLIVGDDFVALTDAGSMARFDGVGSSPGRLRGPVLVVKDPAERSVLPPGTVLAVPHSDVSWTPLFVQAAAVVSEAGGMLSHSSIVARELGIPCVVSAEGVCDLIDGSQVVVDGYEGSVTVVES